MSVKSGIKKNRNQVAMSALTLSLLAAYMAPAHALTTINDDVNVTGYAQIGTTTTSATASTGAGSGSTPPPPSVNNGNGTTTLYNISAYGASNVSSTSTTGGVLAEPSGNITGTGGQTTTTSSTWDVASYIIVASSNVSQVLTTGSSLINMMNSTATVAGEGGNLVMSGNGTFGGDLYVAGTIYGNGTDGALVLHGGTASTTITIDNNGVNIADSVNGQTFNLDNAGNVLAAGNVTANSFITGNTTLSQGQLAAVDDLVIQADSNSGGVGAIVLQKGATTLATFDSTGAEFYTALDMNGNNINGVGTITATTGNITTINSTTINNSGTVTTNDLQATTATIGQMGFSNNEITAPDDLILNVDAGPGGYGGAGGLIIQKADNTLAEFNENGDGGLQVYTTATVNNSFTVDTNGGSANVTGTGRVVMSNNTAVVGVQNAGGGLNGITSNSTQTVVSGGTGTSTLTLQQNYVSLYNGASYGDYVQLNQGNADMYGLYTAQISNAYGSGFEASYSGAYMYGNSEAVVSGGSSSMRLDSDGATFSGEGGSPIRVHGVADGKAQKDAVNVSQLESQRDSLSGGIASIAAIANIPHVDPKKTFAVGIGYGNYDGQSGYAVGGSYRFMEDGILKASVAGSDDGETAWGVGAGFSW